MPGPGSWFGLVAEPDGPDIVPVLFVPWLGIVDSLTYARHTVLAAAPVSAYLAADEHDEGDIDWFQGASEDWDCIIDPLDENPTSGTVASVIVALQRIAIEMGREWVSAGFELDDLLRLWPAHDETRPIVAGLCGWVTSRWATEPDKQDVDLHPRRALALGLTVEELVESAKALAFRIADLTLAVDELNSHQFVALHPWRRDRVLVVNQPGDTQTSQMDNQDPWGPPAPF